MGDNVGDIAGMGADLFGSFAESTCAALVVTSVSSLGANHLWVSMCYPLLISGECGLMSCCVFFNWLVPACFGSAARAPANQPASQRAFICSDWGTALALHWNLYCEPPSV